MRMVSVVLFALCLVSPVKADMLLITATNSPNQISVSSNQVLIISSVRAAYAPDGFFPSPYFPAPILNGTFSSNSIQYPFLLPYNNVQALAWSGPVTLTIPNTNSTYAYGASGPFMVSYQLIQNTNIQTIIIPQTNFSPSLVSFQVPAGRKAHFFAPFSMFHSNNEGNWVGGLITVSNGAQSIQIMMTGGEEISGPATVTVGQTSAQMASIGVPNNFCEVYSYYLTDAFTSSPVTGYIQGGTGTFQIAIESSQDLLNWTQVIYYPTSSNQKAFYRMRITQ